MIKKIMAVIGLAISLQWPVAWAAEKTPRFLLIGELGMAPKTLAEVRKRKTPVIPQLLLP